MLSSNKMSPFKFSSQLCSLLVLFLLGVEAQTEVESWNITWHPKEPEVHIDRTTTIEFNVTGPDIQDEPILFIKTQNVDLLISDYEIPLHLDKIEGFYSGHFNITGVFLGKTNILMTIKTNKNQSVFEQSIPVRILRTKRPIDTIFTASVAILVSLIYINFGCALNWAEIKATVRRPVGPAIALASQFILMPLLSFGLGKLLFPTSTDMQLGMFFTGVSPGGGASNMWTVILGGNMDLSVTMTTISTFAAFAMMPLWLFTLGREIFHKSDIPVPYTQITTYAIALVVPLFIGYLIQKYLKRIGQFLAKILKGFASMLLIFIVVFAIVANLYLFKLFSWQIIVSGLGLPWLGYGLSWLFAKCICRQNHKDSLTIAIETGIQNTGIAIFLLRFTLPQPEADLTTIAPVAVAIMTPVPLLILYIIQKIRLRFRPASGEKLAVIEDVPDSKDYATMNDAP